MVELLPHLRMCDTDQLTSWAFSSTQSALINCLLHLRDLMIIGRMRVDDHLLLMRLVQMRNNRYLMVSTFCTENQTH